MSELETATRLAVEVAGEDGADAAEAYAAESREREVRAHGGGLESLSAATQRGLGVRAWIGHRVGFAYGTELTPAGLRRTAGRAVAAARIADEDEFAAAPVPGPPLPEMDAIRDPTVEEWQTDRVADLALAVERAAVASEEGVDAVETAVYADSIDLVSIHCSTGIAGAYEASSAFAYAQALAGGEGPKETGLGFGLGRSPAGLDPEAIGREAATRAAAMIGATKPPSRACPVVLDPTVAASFVGLVGSLAAADAVQRGRSPLADRLGEEVASAAFALEDDGTAVAGLRAAPFDDEGVARRRVPLIADGRLQTFLHDSYTAHRGDTESTGSAGRGGYRSAPLVATSNLIVPPGTLQLSDLLRAAGDGLYVSDVAGLHSGVNPVTGRFSVGASGRLVSGGELADPVREFTIAGDLVSMLRSVTQAGAEPRWVPFGGSVCTPALLVGEMTVSGA
jgi:PmbA protein